jgi:hypothetical protein
MNPFLIFGFLISIHLVLGVYFYRAYRYREGDPGDEPAGVDRI